MMVLLSPSMSLLCRNSLLHGTSPICQVRDMLIATLRAQFVQGPLQPPKVVLVQTTRALGPVDVLGQGLDVLRAGELVVVRGADVDEGADGRRAVGRVEGRVVDRVAVDLADVEVVLRLVDPVGRDAVGRAPDLVRGGVVVIPQRLPVGPLDEGDDAARGLGRAAVVLAVGVGERVASAEPNLREPHGKFSGTRRRGDSRLDQEGDTLPAKTSERSL